VDKPGLGRLIWLHEVIDQRGRPAGPHAAIILTTQEEHEAGAPIVAVVVSSKLHHEPEDEMVLLPWAKGGHPQTKLSKKSAAICRWIVQVEESNIASYGNLIYGRLLQDILECVRRLQRTTDQ
jgi:hypothetical protein